MAMRGVEPRDCLRAVPNPEIRRPLTISKAETPAPQRDAAAYRINTQSTALSLFPLLKTLTDDLTFAFP